ncbi:MAG: hypothetical protein P4M07_28155 [Xanthobacteraceae bacterium]|nr:hypothetical protein [Xanthobacteraceae bacterium]
MTALIVLADLAIFAAGLFAGRSAAKIKAWASAEEARVRSDVTSAAAAAERTVTAATGNVAADVAKKA